MESDSKKSNVTKTHMRPDHAARLDSAQKQFSANRRQFQQMLPDLQTVSGRTKDKAEPSQRAISHRFRYSESDAAIESKLRILSVEIQLQQAAALLDRVLGENTTYRQLLVDQTNLGLDIQEYQALDVINDEEREAGLFSVPYWEASASLASDDAVKQATNELADWIHDQMPTQLKYAAWSTENGQQPIATGWENKLSKHVLRLYGGFTPDSKDVPQGTQATDGNIVGGIISYQISNYSLTFQEKQLRAQVLPGTQRAPFLTAKKDYYNADVGFRERRRIAAHTKLIDKLQAIRAPGGPLNYAERLSAIEERAAADLKQAYARMIVLKRGLRLVYGLDAPDLPRVPKHADEAIEPNFIDQTIFWLRAVASSLQLLTGNDQDFVFPVSLGRALGWDEFRQGSRDRAWEFYIDKTALTGLKLVRLRAISASVKGGCNDPLSFVVKAPNESFFIHSDNTTPFNQNIDDCWLGRVRCNTSGQGSDICGTKVLFNASPFGKWIVRPVSGINTNDIEDLQVNLYLVAQVQK